jgi:hypothetical protein
MTIAAIEKRRREDKCILASRKPQWSTEEALVLARIAWCAMSESDL